MKKLCTILLAVTLLTGCGAQAASVHIPEATPIPTLYAPAGSMTPGAPTTESTAATNDSLPAPTVQTTEPEEDEKTAPSDTAEAVTEPEADVAAPEKEPQRTEPPAAESEPQQTTQTGSAAEAETPSTQKPSDQEASWPYSNAPKPTDNAVLRLNKTDISFLLGKEAKVTCEYTGSGRLRWYTSSPSLRIDMWGILTASSVGDYTLYVTDGVYAAAARVAVSPVPEPVGDIWFEQESITMMERTTTLVEVKGDTTGEYVTYVSSDSTIVETSGGFLMAKRPGTVTITATHGGRRAELTVTVTMDPQVERLILDQTELVLYDDSVFQLTWYYTGHGTLQFKSSDPNVVRVTNDGVVVPMGVGECEIFVSDNMRGQGCKVTVIENPNKVYAERIVVEAVEGAFYDGVILQVGDVVRFRTYALPAQYKGYVNVDCDNWEPAWIDWEWVSGGIYLVSVCCNEPGTATLTLTSEDGCASVSCRFTVEERPR